MPPRRTGRRDEPGGSFELQRTPTLGFRTARTTQQRGLLVAILIAITLSPAMADDVDDAAAELMAGYRADLEELAGWCDGRGLDDEARRTREWLRSRNPNKIYVAELPRQMGWSAVPEGTTGDRAEWGRQFTRHRKEQADAMFDLARRAILANRPSLAFDLVLGAIREDPDHAAIRRMLGYQPYQGEWRTHWEVAQLRKGRVEHERFGWLPRTYVARYEDGQRYSDGRWITAEADAGLHDSIRSGWVVETEHYQIHTNHSIEAGVDLGKKLERLYRVWKQLFVRYYASDAQVRALFSSRARQLVLPRHKVVYFRDRNGYNAFLRGQFPQIGISTGIYVDGVREAYFFAGDEHDERTLYHEATHQLFHESRPVAAGVGRSANFWVIEGIAMYMESLHHEAGCHALGGFDDLRMKAARYRLLEDDFYVPLSQFTALGMQELQADPRIATLYSQAAGLTHFLIHYDHGRYRDALVSYLVAVYAGRADSSTLATLTGTSYAELDKQYHEFTRTAGGRVEAGG